MDTDIVFTVEGDIGFITLNRPRARNALTHPMVEAIALQLDAWEVDDGIRAVLVRGAGEHGLCAGGDVRAMYAGAVAKDDSTAEFFRAEYRMNARIHRFSKPYVALMDGLAMGGGLGVSAHGSHRIVTERSMLAMPEVTIGICPDVGATWLLAHAPGQLGSYLAMTGVTFGPGDAIYAGLADYYLPSDALEQFEERIVSEPLDSLLEDLSEPAPMSPLEGQRAWIDACFGDDDALTVLAALESSGSDEARATADLIRTKSPTAVAVSCKAIHRARDLESLEHALELEFGVSCYLMYGHDGIEGVRALIIDKDRNPQWDPPSLEDLSAVDVDSAFAPSPYGSLGLTR